MGRVLVAGVSARLNVVTAVDVAQLLTRTAPHPTALHAQAEGLHIVPDCEAALKGLLLIASLLSFAGAAFPQSQGKESAAVLELGAAADRSLTESQSSVGATVAVEVEPIENWLELEAGVTPLFRRHATEWAIDLLFKKPWTLSDRTEFMIGVGPEWIHTNAYGVKTNSVGVEIAPDFMFWGSRKHRFGWYLEPSYEYKLGHSHEQSLAITGGLLIAIP
jgi:hypothetical protein